MEPATKTAITVETTVNTLVEKAWDFFTNPVRIIQWYHASDDWHAPYADNDLREGGKFKTTMASKDGKMSFDFEGEYTLVVKHERIDYSIVDGRKVKIIFITDGSKTSIMEIFEPENTNSHELQRSGWQSILDNFKKYTESN